MHSAEAMQELFRRAHRHGLCKEPLQSDDLGHSTRVRFQQRPPRATGRSGGADVAAEQRAHTKIDGRRRRGRRLADAQGAVPDEYVLAFRLSLAVAGRRADQGA